MFNFTHKKRYQIKINIDTISHISGFAKIQMLDNIHSLGEAMREEALWLHCLQEFKMVQTPMVEARI